MKILLTILFLLLTSPAWAMQKYLDYVTDTTGQAIVGASILVNLAGTSTAATLYSDDGVTPLANPIISEVDGSYYFYAATGLYDLVVTKAGYVFDADDTAGIQVGASANYSNAIRTMDAFTTIDVCAATVGAIDVIGSTPVTLVIDRAVTCSTDRTVPRTLGLTFLPGGRITVGTTKTLTINGPFEAPITQHVFLLSGTGVVRFGTTNITTLYPQWWASKTLGDDTGDDSVAINLALAAATSDASVRTKSGKVHLANGIYKITSTLNVGKDTILEGDSTYGTQIHVASAINALTINGDNYTGGYDFRVTLRDFSIHQTGTDAANYYLYVKKAYECTFERLFMYGTMGNGIYLELNNQIVMNAVDVEGAPPSAEPTGTGLTIVNGSVTTYGMIIEFFLNGVNAQKSASYTSLTMFGTYFEHITGTYVTLDNVTGCVFVGMHMQNGQGTIVPAPVGFSFINGAHHNSIFGGNVAGNTDWAFEPPFKTDATSYQNGVYGAQIYLPNGTLPEAGVVLNGSAPVKIVTYAGTMTFDTKVAEWFDITATSNAARTIAAPTNASSIGTHLYVTVRNTSGGALGTWTWNAVFKMPTWDSPATGFNRTYHFLYDGTNWGEVSRSSADIPN